MVAPGPGQHPGPLERPLLDSILDTGTAVSFLGGATFFRQGLWHRDGDGGGCVCEGRDLESPVASFDVLDPGRGGINRGHEPHEPDLLSVDRGELWSRALARAPGWHGGQEICGGLSTGARHTLHTCPGQISLQKKGVRDAATQTHFTSTNTDSVTQVAGDPLTPSTCTSQKHRTRRGTRAGRGQSKFSHIQLDP